MKNAITYIFSTYPLVMMEATAIDKTHVANDTLERFLSSMQSVVLFKAALSQLFFADIAGNIFAT